MMFSFKIGAQAGAGVMVTGRMMAKCFTRGGFHVVEYPEYPSLVRGGHNVVEVAVSDKQMYSPTQKCDVVIALNKDAIFYHKDFVKKGGVIIYDEPIDTKQFKIPKDVHLLPVPLIKLIEKAGGNNNMINVVALASALALVEYPFEILAKVIEDEFGRKGAEIVKKNIDAATEGYNYVTENKGDVVNLVKTIKPTSNARKMLIAGNEAIALGAVKGGMKFYSAYPMTPASSILHYLFANERNFNIVVKQTEDEIAAMNYAIGASFAGVRSMTGTSGGGFALMTEALGMAALAETPIVTALVQRVGPSTGMPTWTEQADLRFALHASQGDFLRVILAPGDVDECFYLGAEAFNLAEKYQLPVIIISDKFLAETVFSTERFDEKKMKIERGKIVDNLPALEPNTRYKRYKLTKDGVSPRVFPGTPNGMHVGTSYEHDETGFSSESFIMRTKQVDKRDAKLAGLLKEIPAPEVYGPKKAPVTIVCWGSHKLPALDALGILENNGIKANVLHFSYLFPLDKNKIEKAMKQCTKTVMFENNSTGQFTGMLKQYCDVEPDFLVLKYDGRQFFAEQMAEEIGKLVKKKFKGDKDIRICEKEDLEYYNQQRYGL
ncbi:2-oxoacid:acceptor oxidoreductase subunit alpha [Candidatus Micrarchaeota archaeon]|nr:2-oxoacid:acceptor oxidoreductase subunit alpha [Candidatus Micrarchaeota archaeon]MBU1166040.1 2-oxoacid:acceptor oxidoreductase subunit alpha [Candidatus Micrarchaeota archaeon]MBU1886756.1 2-oxoacid:acceptor oxidoreductase subunit alpha [Candidatus Micrarchaeota archaeon]